ncbi:guanine deaminase [Vararia minispora EC-137]|uniref:Guanine deaminase n=1 Tax=Vararia minispora EC-137 TaxID=1314806 RepID=A0ACB8Q9A5_9AGAM|nr:guanine deaminase [Vararia minispora EC-137]
MTNAPLRTVFYGPVISSKDLTAYHAWPRCVLCVGADGHIAWIEHDVAPSDLQTVLETNGSADANFIELRAGEFLLPGFVDTHTHAPQVPNIGSGQQYTLLEWLQHVTFPMEEQFADVSFAHTSYKDVVRRIIDSGTTTCCYYSTLHLDATKALADVVHAAGQRAFVGKCNMDVNDLCATYVESDAAASLRDTDNLIAYIRALPHDLVRPVLTPRFALSCSRQLLSALGERARADRSLLVQTHIDENIGEIQAVHNTFPECSSYAAVYDKYNLLGQHTVLAHAVHLTDAELELIKERRSGVAHCPTSNFNLNSGICNVGRLLDNGINARLVGLGTDISGGFSTSILTEIRHASIASKALLMHTGSESQRHTDSTFEGKPLGVAACLHLATLGGARVCGLGERVGKFAPGYAFDALLVSVRTDAGNPRLWGVEQDRELGIKRLGHILDSMLERFLFTGDDRNILRVYVQGKCIGGAAWR